MPKITWSKLNGSIPLVRSTHNNKQLIIDRIMFENRVYECQAANSVGSVKTQTTVIVLGWPIYLICYY